MEMEEKEKREAEADNVRYGPGDGLGTCRGQKRGLGPQELGSQTAVSSQKWVLKTQPRSPGGAASSLLLSHRSPQGSHSLSQTTLHKPSAHKWLFRGSDPSI